MVLARLKEKGKGAAQFLARADLFSFALLWLMVLLVAGTVSQKEIGLYMAQKIYFSSFFLWLWDFVPLPGMLAVVVFIFAGLACRLALDRWEARNAGIIITHLGAMLLLLGGFITAQFSHEGVMVIPEGRAQSFMEDTRHVELALTDDKGRETVFSEGDLTREKTLAAPDLPFTLSLDVYCRNCALQRLPQSRTEGAPRGVAINFDLSAIPRDPVDERNRAGVTFRIDRPAEAQGLYTVFEDMPLQQTVTAGGQVWRVIVRRARTALPFAIRLDDFERAFYPGTDEARSYQSAVMVQDKDAAWPALIRMNEPLRYKGYTFYQSSFLEGGGMADETVLAVVQNAGRTFPYLSGGLICFGILLHMLQRYGRRSA